MISRYLKSLKELGFIVTYVCNKSLIDLFRSYLNFKNLKIEKKLANKILKNLIELFGRCHFHTFFIKKIKKIVKS